MPLTRCVSRLAWYDAAVLTQCRRRMMKGVSPVIRVYHEWAEKNGRQHRDDVTDRCIEASASSARTKGHVLVLNHNKDAGSAHMLVGKIDIEWENAPDGEGWHASSSGVHDDEHCSRPFADPFQRAPRRGTAEDRVVAKHLQPTGS